MKVVLSTLILMVSLNTTIAFAHGDHEEFPEGTLLALEGQDAISKEECFLFVTDVSPTGATIQTSYHHGEAAAAPFQVKAHPTKAGVLVGTGSNGQDQIAIFLGSQDLDLRTATSFNIKWLHHDHFHTNRCLNLQVHEH